jgi:hypothetical protein
VKQPAGLPDFSIALGRAVKLFELKTGSDLSWSELARRVDKRLGKEGGMDAAKMSRIKLGQQEPSRLEIWALALELDADPRELAFPASAVSAVPKEPAEIHHGDVVTPEDERARKTASKRRRTG